MPRGLLGFPTLTLSQQGQSERGSREVIAQLERSSQIHASLRCAFADSIRPATGAEGSHESQAAARIIGGNMLGRSRLALEREFLTSCHGRPQNKAHPVFHTSFSESGPGSLSDADWARVATRHVTMLGFADAAYAVVRRHDTIGVHVHVIAARLNTWHQPIPRPSAAVIASVLGQLR